MSATAWLFPGQGSQRKGMGAELFARHPDLADRAGEVLGWSVTELCRDDQDRRLRDTRYAQPALYVVAALAARDRTGGGETPPDVVAGHSLGEYGALLAAGCFDFETGLRLVAERGRLMAAASGGGMLAVVGPAAARIDELLDRHRLGALDLANVNGPDQVVLSGPQDALREAAGVLGTDGTRCVPLAVSAPFHSRYMAGAAERFATVLAGVEFRDPAVEVLAGATGEPYAAGTVREVLSRQIREPVRWTAVTAALQARGVTAVEELGPGRVLTTLWTAAPPAAPPPPAPTPATPAPTPAPAPVVPAAVATEVTDVAPVAPGVVTAEELGCQEYRQDHGVRLACVAGSMYHGIASVDLVVRMVRAGLLGYLGAGGLRPDVVAAELDRIEAGVGAGVPYGANLLHSVDDGGLEAATAALYVRRDVRYVEAAGYTQVTPALLHARFAGAHRDRSGRPVPGRHVMAKASRPEVAAAFLRPPDPAALDALVREGLLTVAEAEVARELPVSHDLCVEADSGGHTDGGVAYVLMPAMLGLRDEAMKQHRYAQRIRVGAAGGIGSPEAVAAAFVLGADFLVTGSVNQCSPEAGTSDAVKDLLAGLDVQDTTYAPAGDMFELGARVQVVRKGTLFPPRANRLYQLWRHAGSLDELDPATSRTLQENWFGRTFDEIWAETREYLARTSPDTLARAERDPKQRMALVFRWYFVHSSRLALRGETGERVNFQVHSGPAIGAFNRFAAGTPLADWRNRHVDAIAESLMRGGAAVLTERLGRLTRTSEGDTR